MHSYFVTYFDRNYLTRGISLCESLQARVASSYTLFIVCMDELTRTILRRLSLPNTHLIAFHEIESRDWSLTATRHSRSATEYLWTSTPTIIRHAVGLLPTDEPIIYLDADQYMFGDPATILSELGKHSCLIHEHRFSPGLEHLSQNGIFNVGTMCFRHNTAGLRILQWWRERCLEWCYSRSENGKMGDQGYLNDWPTRFADDVRVTPHIGIGTAPWNMQQYAFSAASKGEVYVNDRPLILFHFHSLKLADPRIVIPVHDLMYGVSPQTLQHCYAPYCASLLRSLQRAQSIAPLAAHGYHPDLPVTPHHAIMGHASASPELVRAGFVKRYEYPDSEWNAFGGSQIV